VRIVFRPHRCFDVVYSYTCLDVACHMCLSVCLLVTKVNPSKMAEPVEMRFGMWTCVGLRNHILDGGQILSQEGTSFGKARASPL